MRGRLPDALPLGPLERFRDFLMMPAASILRPKPGSLRVVAKSDGLHIIFPTGVDVGPVSAGPAALAAGAFVNRTSTATLTGTPATMSFNNVVSDPDGAWNSSTFLYTTPKAGRYIAHLYVELNAPTTVRKFPAVDCSDGQNFRGSDVTEGPSGSYEGGAVTAIADFAAGVTIKATLFIASGSLTFDTPSYFRIIQIA